MKLDLKLLCLALVLCQQSEQAETCRGGSTAVMCNGKPGGELELTATGASGTVTWTKGDTGPTDAEKYLKTGPHSANMKIKNLDDTDEETYKAAAPSITGTQDFVVNVGDCFGGATETTCSGSVGGSLKLKATGVTGGTVKWEKEGSPGEITHIASVTEIVRTTKDGLKILNLKPESAGTYIAKDGTGMTGQQKFKVKVSSDGGSDTNTKTTNTTNTTPPTTTSKRGNSAKGLSYSPALLVTTLVHLLLQLAN
ncbi:uncharacterized protein [Syngnathus scovelli]|uniref:uncharacterized protein isoform X2 n=1 Tax=Syngnathus scovelli TaxID=161590 RepID=UPI0021101CEA|nr:uncharacterized protein LOC125975583 isoform X2 [Syngnathus scovelli]